MSGDLWDDDPEYYGGPGARWAYDTWWYRNGGTVIEWALLVILLFALWKEPIWLGYFLQLAH